ncbi:MAG: GGDEF domain-containing protein, partial [Actinomycetia bacterium]|nr:GGDEF domain-containing protein [Actinomycetes bacterium]
MWNQEGASLRITVLPPPWKTWWAYLLYTLIAAGVIAGYVRSHRRELGRERAVSARLREVDKLKDEFLANTSHELRTPLNGITGLAESLIDGVAGEVPAAVKSNLSMIVQSGRRLGHLVGDILDFSMLRHKSLELEPRPVDLRSLVDVVLTLSRPLVGSKELELASDLPADLPAVAADENRLQQILHNLIGNAV